MAYNMKPKPMIVAIKAKYRALFDDSLEVRYGKTS